MQWNVAIYLIITLIVIAAIIVVFFLNRPEDENYFYLMRLGCLELIKNCDKDLDQIQVEGNKRMYNLQELCEFNGIYDEISCKKACNCIIATV